MLHQFNPLRITARIGSLERLIIETNACYNVLQAISHHANKYKTCGRLKKKEKKKKKQHVLRLDSKHVLNVRTLIYEE